MRLGKLLAAGTVATVVFKALKKLRHDQPQQQAKTGASQPGAMSPPTETPDLTNPKTGLQ